MIHRDVNCSSLFLSHRCSQVGLDKSLTQPSAPLRALGTEIQTVKDALDDEIKTLEEKMKARNDTRDKKVSQSYLICMMMMRHNSSPVRAWLRGQYETIHNSRSDKSGWIAAFVINQARSHIFVFPHF